MAKSLRKGVMVRPGKEVDLSRHRPDDTLGLRDREEAERLLAEAGERLAELTTKLAAVRGRALLVVLQGMDASGKDGTVRRCIGPINPMAVRIAAFKAPTATELEHDFLWRISGELPERGQVGVFNRSHYEDVLVVRVEGLAPERVWRPRYDAIAAWERHLDNEGTTVVKLFLNISPEEQAKRFEARITDPTKRWKFNADDLAKRIRWDEYMEAYAEALERTSTEWAPWYVIPANHKWVRNAVVTEILVHVLDGMDLEWPPIDPALASARVT